VQFKIMEDTSRSMGVGPVESETILRWEDIAYPKVSFGEIENVLETILISNDTGAQKVLAVLEEEVKDNDSLGIGLFVGSGGLASFLSALPVEVCLVVDKNIAVLNFSEAVLRAIKDNSSPTGAMAWLSSEDCLRQTPGLAKLVENLRPFFDGGSSGIISRFFAKEAVSYGRFHWTDPEAYSRSRKRLRETEIVHVAADIVDAALLRAIRAQALSANRQIELANLTNIHQWSLGEREDMSFLSQLPFSPESFIVFSDHQGKRPGDEPGMRQVRSLEDYIKWTDGKVGKGPLN